MRDIRKKNLLKTEPPKDESNLVSSDSPSPAPERDDKTDEVARKLEKRKKKVESRKKDDDPVVGFLKMAAELADMLLRYLITSWGIRIGLAVIIAVIGVTWWNALRRDQAIRAEIAVAEIAMVESLHAFHASVDDTLRADPPDPAVPDALVQFGAVESVVEAGLAQFLEAPDIVAADKAAIDVVEMYQAQLASVIGSTDQTDVISRRRTWMRIEELVESRDEFLETRAAWWTRATNYNPKLSYSLALTAAVTDYSPRRMSTGSSATSMELDVVRALPSNVADAEKRKAEEKSGLSWDAPYKAPIPTLSVDTDADVDEPVDAPPPTPVTRTPRPAPPPEPPAAAPEEPEEPEEPDGIEVRTGNDEEALETIRIHRGIE